MSQNDELLVVPWKPTNGEVVIGLLLHFAGHVVRMPCGETYALTKESFRGNIPCPCGNPNHWIIKWE